MQSRNSLPSKDAIINPKEFALASLHELGHMTAPCFKLGIGCGCSSGVEHDLAKVGVKGSNPFTRSNFLFFPKEN
jgi:hypothetical protein